MRVSYRGERSWRRQAIVAGWCMVLGLAGVTAAGALPASAAVENGYVINDPWVLDSQTSLQSSSTPPAYNGVAVAHATSAIDTQAGTIGVTATLRQTGSLAGTNFLTAGNNQDAYGATSAMLIGGVSPANVPALGILSNANGPGCGEIGTPAHSNLEGTCQGVSEITFTFSAPVTDPVFDITGIGGFAQNDEEGSPVVGAGSHAGSTYTILNDDVQWGTPSGTSLTVSNGGKTLGTNAINTRGHCTNVSKDGYTEQPEVVPDRVPAGCGSAVLQGTFSSITLRIDVEVKPYSSYPDAGDAYHETAGGHDGINGLNLVYGEALPVSGPTRSLNDLVRVSFRLADVPPTGGFAVTKSLSGTGEQLVPATAEYSVDYSYIADGVPITGTLSVQAGETESVVGLPIGTVVTLHEQAPRSVPGAAYETPIFTGDSVVGGEPGTATVTIGAASTVAVALENPVTATPPISVPPVSPPSASIPPANLPPVVGRQGSLARTGGGVDIVAIAGGALLLVAGAGLLIWRRHRAGNH